MMTCRCGAPLQPSVTFCVVCGASAHTTATPTSADSGGREHRGWVPAGTYNSGSSGNDQRFAPPAWSAPSTPPARSWAPWVAGVASLLVIALAAVVVVLALRPPATTIAAPSQVPYVPYGYYPGPSSTPTTTTTSPSYPAYPTYDSDPTSSSSDATTELESLASSDSSSVEALAGSWVPQLSSKRSGSALDTTALSDHETLRGEYSSARLLRSDDWSVFGGSGFWVTVVAQPFTSAGAANAWCDAQGRGPDDCFAKYLSHTAGPDGATVHR